METEECPVFETKVLRVCSFHVCDLWEISTKREHVGPNKPRPAVAWEGEVSSGRCRVRAQERGQKLFEL